MSEPKLCKDCKWYAKSNIDSADFDLCMKPASDQKPDLVRGENKRPVKYCVSERDWSGPCGREAKRFEPKEQVTP